MVLLHGDGDALRHHRRIVGHVGVVAHHDQEGVLALGQIDQCLRLAKVKVEVFFGNRLVWVGRIRIN